MSGKEAAAAKRKRVTGLLLKYRLKKRFQREFLCGFPPNLLSFVRIFAAVVSKSLRNLEGMESLELLDRAIQLVASLDPILPVNVGFPSHFRFRHEDFLAPEMKKEMILTGLQAAGILIRWDDKWSTMVQNAKIVPPMK